MIQHVIATRLRRAAAALRTTRKPVTAIAFDVGFGDVSHFVRSFTRICAVAARLSPAGRLTHGAFDLGRTSSAP